MATTVGGDATAAGYALVQETGEEGRVRWGAREINRTRDFIAQVKNLIPANQAGYRTKSGISSGTAAPTGGVDGDIYFQVLL